ncbi:MAG: phosphate acyltransferase PlsX [Halanaerobiales bacterium]
MKIAVDAMGGDKAPDEIVRGAVRAVNCLQDELLKILLVGREQDIKKCLDSGDSYPEERVKIIGANEVIGMNDAPSRALKKKKDSSIVVGCKMVGEEEADAFISAGNTGAVMASGLFNTGRLAGIKRPSIATVFPARRGETLLLDAGANADCKPENLLQFAVMGQIYAREVLDKKNPRLGLLSIGEEKKKGNKLTVETHELLLQDQRIENFIGNVEGRDIFTDICDIIICDGFVGNVVLKTTEGVASFVMDIFKDVLTRNLFTKIGALFIKSYLKEEMKKVDYKQYGGAPLLGLKGNVIISHGSSDATAIFNAVKSARKTVLSGIPALIAEDINN